jgi:hypothetical protein
MFCSFNSDLIAREVEWSECLYEVENSWMRKRKGKKKFVCLTVLCSRASLRCFAPSAPIWFHSRSSEVSVCMKSKTVVWEKEKERRNYFVLPCYAVVHHSDVLLLQLRFDCSWGWVNWVSVWSRKQLDEKERRNSFLSLSYVLIWDWDVLTWSIRLIGNFITHISLSLRLG